MMTSPANDNVSSIFHPSFELTFGYFCYFAIAICVFFYSPFIITLDRLMEEISTNLIA